MTTDISQRLRPPTPDMQGRELVQWFQRVYDVLQTLDAKPDPIIPSIPSSHNDLSENGGVDSHAAITSHMNAQSAHGTQSRVVGTDDKQTLRNKTLDALYNTLSNLRHGEEVDNLAIAHNTQSDIVGVDDEQVLKNKQIYGQYNTVRNMRHGIEVDSPATGVHGAQGSVVGTDNVQPLFNKLYVHKVSTAVADYIMSLFNSDTVIALAPGITISLPAITSDYIGTTKTIDNKSGGSITVGLQAGAEDIEGEKTQRIPENCSMTVRFDGTSWRII